MGQFVYEIAAATFYLTVDNCELNINRSSNLLVVEQMELSPFLTHPMISKHIKVAENK